MSNEDVVENVLSGNRKDKFVVRLKVKELRNILINLDLLDVIGGRAVLGFAPLPSRGNRMSGYIKTIADDWQRKVAVAALLDELNGDAVQTFEVTSAWTDYESKKGRRRSTVAADKILELKDQVDAHKSEKEGIEILIKATEKMVTECLARSLNQFVHPSNSFMEPHEFFALIKIAERETPNLFEQQKKAIRGSGRYQGKDILRARAFFMFLASLRQGNRKLLNNWAMILVLANAKDGAVGRPVKYLANLGFALSSSAADKAMKALRTTVRCNAEDVLRNQKTFIFGFDNFQIIDKKKYSNDGKGSTSLEGTCRYAVEVLKPVNADSFRFPMLEGMPEKIEYETYKIPAPPGMHPFENIMKMDDDALYDYLKDLAEGDMTPPLSACVFPDGVDSESAFDMDKMPPTNGERVQKYMELLELCEVLGNFRRFLSSKNLAESEEWKENGTAQATLQLMHKSREFLLAANKFQEKTVHTWNSVADACPRIYALDLSKYKETSTIGIGCVLTELYRDFGLLKTKQSTMQPSQEPDRENWKNLELESGL